MLRYKGKVLTKLNGTLGGKNQIKGFYEDSEGQVYFIKKPTDLKELFTELLAGLLLKEFKKRHLIPSRYMDSLIDADWIQFEDGSYGLIQPKIEFTELHKIIGTGFRDGSDRNPLIEMLSGSNRYAQLTKKLTPYYGLSMALMFSILFGDYSVHSGNVVCCRHQSTPEGQLITQFARIDWGAAFRYFGYYDDILNPFEYQGWLNFKIYSKGYIFNYKKIKGLFPAMAEKATNLLEKIDEDLVQEMICSALQSLPVDLLTASVQKELATYLGIPSFEKVMFDEQASYQPFAIDFCNILFKRLDKLRTLKDLTGNHSFLYQSMIFATPLTDMIFHSEDKELTNILKDKNLDLVLKNEANKTERNKIDIEQEMVLMKRFYHELLQDHIFKNTLSSLEEINFSLDLIKDLLILKDFYKLKRGLNNDDNLDRFDHDLLDEFYKNTLLIRLSKQDKLSQAQSLLAIAYQFFAPKYLRVAIWQDILNMLGSLFNGENLILKINHQMSEKERFFKPVFTTPYTESLDLTKHGLA
ncbi:substrate of the Dot/Icm secretion system, LepB-like [Legionella beliardensis]|uniref:Substrate of the Dot/Icm secretion system, LepB-like n=1 Tax=Legionella beliardensis TaxID=91822 RepID=A0A378HYW5_9GAMM|nr:hypothetical protein [Legionella beliardensis]STX28099.1 substrate of the Dot/Icm secretion system, LepB-like [Legionella beliardensis]